MMGVRRAAAALNDSPSGSSGRACPYPVDRQLCIGYGIRMFGGARAMGWRSRVEIEDAASLAEAIFAWQPARPLRRCAKRMLDVVVALLLLLLMLPLMLTIVVLLRVEAPGSPFYRARRVGYGGAPLMILKFRKMPPDAGGPPLTAAHDPRLSRLGAVLARTRLDELPQLWNVLCGQMSLVGPRPEDPSFVALQREGYARVLRVRPGITGWSQLAFAHERRILSEVDPLGDYIERILPAKVSLDRRYVEHARLRHDLAVLVWTAIAVTTGVEVAVDRRTGKLRRRRARGPQDAGPEARRTAACRPQPARTPRGSRCRTRPRR
jgi:lipopolysaccharide/colanic/teichoic acid biosynthesis glycosyltransferase